MQNKSKIKILRFVTPGVAEITEAKIIAEPDGNSYILFSDIVGERKHLLTDDVKQIKIYEKTLFGSKETNYYLMARDNFINFEKNNFIVKGELTRELAKKMSEWGFLAELARLSKEETGINIKMIIVLIIIGAILFLAMPTISEVLGGFTAAI